MSNPAHEMLPLWRVNLLSVMYLFMAVGRAVVIRPKLLFHGTESARRFGNTRALHVAIGTQSLLGMRYPAQMLPLMLFELLWKIIWIVAIGLPLGAAGRMTDAMRDSAWEIGLGVVLIPLVLPWRYLYGHYVAKPAERWR